MTTGTVELGTWAPHDGQRELLAATHRYRTVVVAVGRRWGKTEAAKLALLDHAPWANGYAYQAAYCAPTYKLAKPVYEEFRDTLKGVGGEGLIRQKSDSELKLWLRPMGITLPGGRRLENRGGLINFWSLEEHDNLRGRGLSFVVIDECADVVEAAYRRTLRPMTMDVRGRFLLIGTPKRVGVGATWFRHEFDRGRDPAWNLKGYWSLNGPSHGNPYLPREALQDLIDQTIDHDTVREEIMAEFLEDSGAVFERIGDVFVLPFVEEGRDAWVLAAPGGVGFRPEPGARYAMGVDFARFEDFTVVSVFDVKTRRQVYLYRVTGVPYEEQLARIGQIRERWNGALIIGDETGVGQPLVERLAQRYATGVRPRKWSSNQAKEEDVTRARQLFQRGEVKMLDVPWQRGEFRNYQREKLPTSGMWRYTAPEGGHDDAVAAFCLVSDVLAQPFVESRATRVGPPPLSPDWVKQVSRWRRLQSWLGSSRLR